MKKVLTGNDKKQASKVQVKEVRATTFKKLGAGLLMTRGKKI
jgi:hypothetical protein